MAAKQNRPWWTSQRWAVKAVAVRDSPSSSFKTGDWILIYTTETKPEALRLAKEWSAKMHTPTVVEPGAGHKTQRDL